MEIEEIFQSFDNFEMDLGVLGKFFVDEKNLRFMPHVKKVKKRSNNKMTIKNLIEIHMKKNETINRRAKILQKQQGGSQLNRSSKGDFTDRTNRSQIESTIRKSQRSMHGDDQNFQ